ncbi:MAG: DUF1549 and DUF1553 domain-containing protein [Ignavibacteria bacterium]
MHNTKSKPHSSTNMRLVLTVYVLFIVFIALLIAMTSFSNESSITSKDIDKLIEKKWNESKLKPSEKTTDEEFIRRIYVDLTGRIPNAEEVNSFLEDKSSKKREDKINELLDSKEFGQNMADIWISLLFTQDNRKKVPPYIYSMIKNKFAVNFNQNKPYSEFVYNLISAGGLATTDPSVMYIARFETPEDAAGQTMKIFMGKQIQCAQCHYHPYEKISQEDFYGVAAFFARKYTLPLFKKDQAEKIAKALTRLERLIDIARDKEMEMNKDATYEMSEEMENVPEHENVKKEEKQKDKSKVKKEKRKNRPIPPQWAIDTLKKKMENQNFTPDLLVWDAVNGQMQYEVNEEKKTMGPKYLGGSSASNDAGVDRRGLLAKYLTTTDSKQLALAFVNRFWKHFFGYAFINPVDDFTEKDPGTNPELLDLLADEFVKNNFDVKSLFKLIVNTEVYQLSSTPNSTNKDDHSYFSRAVLRPMSPVQLANSLMSASGYFNLKNMQNKNPEDIDKIKIRILQLFIFTFDDDEMNESEDFSGTITQALLLMNSEFSEKVTEKRPGNAISEILKSTKDPEERINLLYLNTLSRYPNKNEKKSLLNKAGNEDAYYENILWALLNSSEFIFNH